MYTTYSGDHLSAATKATGLPFVILAYLVAIVLPIKIDVGSLAISGTRLLLLVLSIPLFINLLRGIYGRILWTDLFFFLHVLWIVVCLFKNNPNQALQFGGSVSLEFFGGYLLARAYIRDKTTFLALAKTLGTIAICTLPFAFYEAQTGRPILIDLLDRLPGINTENDVRQEPRLGLERTQVVFAHPIHYGIFCCLVFSLVLVALKGHISHAKRYVLSALICVCVFFSLSSGALLPLLLQSALIIWTLIFKQGYTRWLLLIGLLVTIYITIDLLSNRTPIRVFMTYATFSTHNAYWRALIFEYGIQNVWQNPIFGLGLNDWIRPSWMFASSVDNFWLLMAMSYGIPGFLFIALGCGIAVIRISLRKFHDNIEISQIRLAWMFIFISITFALSTVHIWSNVYSFVFFLFGSGMWLSHYDTTAEENKKGGDQLLRDGTKHQRTRTPSSEDLKQHYSKSPQINFTRFPKNK